MKKEKKEISIFLCFNRTEWKHRKNSIPIVNKESECFCELAAVYFADHSLYFLICFGTEILISPFDPPVFACISERLENDVSKLIRWPSTPIKRQFVVPFLFSLRRDSQSRFLIGRKLEFNGLIEYPDNLVTQTEINTLSII